MAAAANQRSKKTESEKINHRKKAAAKKRDGFWRKPTGEKIMAAKSNGVIAIHG